jgi:hypothetical protein
MSAVSGADALTRACGERLAGFAAGLIGAPGGALPDLSDFCSDALVAACGILAPELPPAVALARGLGLLSQTTATSDARSALAAVTGGKLDEAMRQALAAATPTLAQLGALGTSAARPAALLGAGTTAASVPGVTKPFGRTGLAKWVAQHWPGRVPGTRTWDELDEQLVSAAALAAIVPGLAAALSALGLRERPSSRRIGKLVQSGLDTAYRKRHEEHFVVFDSILWRGDVRYGDIAEQAPAITGDQLVDLKIAHTLFAYGFPSLDADTAKPGFPKKGRLFRPDILDLTSNRLFEIKPIRSLVEAVPQLWAYQTMLNASFAPEPALGLVQPGAWRIPARLFPISNDRKLWVFAFIFPGFGTLAPLPGIVTYLVFEAVKREIRDEDRRALEDLLVSLLGAALAAQLRAPGSQPEAPQPQPESDDEPSDSWEPNGEYPGDDVPENDEEDEPEQPWDLPTPQPSGWQQPSGAQPSVQQRSAGEEVLQLLEDHWLAVLVVVIVVVWFVFGGELELGFVVLGILGAAAELAAFVAEAGPVLAGAMALLILVVRRLLGGAPASSLSPATATLLHDRGEAIWADVALSLATMSGMPPDALRLLGLPEASTPAARA